MAYFSFSLLDAVQKTAIIYHSVFQLLFIKYCFVLMLSFIESRRKKNFTFYKSANIKIQLLRSILSIVESGCFILSFKYLSLANAHSIASLTPVLVVALSAIFLREHVSLKTWVAIFFGFVGVIIIMRPGLSIFDPKSLIPLLGAFFLSIYQIVTRKASMKDSNETSLFYTSIVGIILTGIIGYQFWQPLVENSYIQIKDSEFKTSFFADPHTHYEELFKNHVTLFDLNPRYLKFIFSSLRANFEVQTKNLYSFTSSSFKINFIKV